MATRRLKTTGLYNARDLGGYPTADGKVTRFGVFIRSEAPVGLPESDIAYLKAYGVTASIDIRSTIEATTRPSDLQEAMTFYHRSLFHEAAIPGQIGGPKPPIHTDWGNQYIEMAETSREWAKDVLSIAAENPGGLLYHCTTGKDRTGLLSCYLLSIAGVSRADIAADYCVSQIYLEPVYEKMRSGAIQIGPPPAGKGGPGDVKGPLLNDSFCNTPPSAMFTVIDYLTKTYGGVVPYLREIGVSEEIMEKIRNKFTQEETP